MVRSLDDFYTILKNGMEIPGTYFKYKEKEGPGLPFYIYFSDNNDSFYADNQNYAESVRVFIEVYTAERDDVLEKRTESILKDNDLTFTKEVDFIEDEDCYMITYTIHILEG